MRGAVAIRSASLPVLLRLDSVDVGGLEVAQGNFDRGGLIPGELREVVCQHLILEEPAMPRENLVSRDAQLDRRHVLEIGVTEKSPVGIGKQKAVMCLGALG